MSGYSEEHLETKIKEAMAVDHVKAVDESDGCGAKFNITIVSNEFAGIPLLARHRKIHEILSEEMKSIHAMTLKTITPDKWTPDAV